METFPYNATVIFPEFFEDDCAGEFNEDPEGKIGRGSFKFTFEKYLIEAHILVDLPTHVLDLPQIREEWIKPVTVLIRKDIQSIADLLPRFRQFARDKVTQDTLYFSRPHGGLRFHFYDYSRANLFAIVERFKSIPKGIIKPEMEDIARLSYRIEKKGTDTSHIAENSLREAAETAIQIYEMRDRLVNINFD